MKILLVDDNLKHRRAGKRDLESQGHEVTALSSYVEALEMMENEHFDAVLLDLLMPAEPRMLSTEARTEWVGREIAVGFPLVLHAVRCGIPIVLMATDTNHHAHPMSALVDWFDHIDHFVLNETIVCVRHARLTADGAKDWAVMLQSLIGDN